MQTAGMPPYKCIPTDEHVKFSQNLPDKNFFDTAIRIFHDINPFLKFGDTYPTEIVNNLPSCQNVFHHRTLPTSTDGGFVDRFFQFNIIKEKERI